MLISLKLKFVCEVRTDLEAGSCKKYLSHPTHSWKISKHILMRIALEQ